MLLLLWMACQADDGPSGQVMVQGGVTTIDVSALDDVISVARDHRDNRVGTAVVAGSDLDRDGVREWATVRYDVGYEGDVLDPEVEVHEGAELVRRVDDDAVRWWVAYGETLAAGDVDGDGHAELVVEAHANATGRFRVLGASSDEDRTLLVDDGLEYPRPGGVGVGTGPDGAELFLSTHQGSDRRVARVSGGDLPPGTSYTLPDARWLVLEDPVAGPFWRDAGALVVVDLDSDGTDDHLLLGFHDHVENDDDLWERRGGLWLGPLDGGVESGRWMGGDPDLEGVGAQASALDLDGDGQAEIVTSAPLVGSPDQASVGTVTVFSADGTVLATLRGDRAVFGAAHALVSFEGEPWLVVSAHGTKLLGFPGADLSGPLSEDDATRVWQLGAQPVSLTGHRATDDAPLQLVVGYGIGVEVFPFDP